MQEDYRRLKERGLNYIIWRKEPEKIIQFIKGSGMSIGKAVDMLHCREPYDRIHKVFENVEISEEDLHDS